MSLLLSDDNFSDSLSQKADSEASSGHAGEDKCSGKDISSPTDTRISEAYIARYAIGVDFKQVVVYLVVPDTFCTSGTVFIIPRNTRRKN